MGFETKLMGTDRWSLKPAFASLTIVAALTLLGQLPGSASFLLIPLSLVGFAIASLVILVLAVRCMVKRRWRRGASVLLIVLLPVLLWQPVKWAANMAHLGLTVGFGAGIGVVERGSDGNFAAYDWSVGLAGGPSTLLIHDVTDEVALPIAQHTHPTSSQHGLREECANRVRLLIGLFRGRTG
jgi:hypothetical protein